MKRRSPLLAEASFDPKLKTYWVLSGCGILILSVVGIVLLPIWLIVGPGYAQRYFENLACELTEKSLIVKKGIWFKSEKTIPLGKIQDFSLKEGPILRWLGLAKLDIETAGQSSGQGQSEASLIGVQDVYAFRDEVLEQAERIAERKGHPASGSENGTSADVLGDIHETLQRIEKLLAKRADAGA